MYPRARIALYYHGGEVASGVVRDEGAARDGLQLADAVFVNTAFSRDQVLARGCAPERIHVLPVGFDVRQFPFAPERRPAADRVLPADRVLRLAVVGRLGRDKGIDYAIDAMQMLVSDGVMLDAVIIGDGDQRGHLERRARDAGLEQVVHFVGTRPHHEVIDTLAAVDVALMPSVPTGNWSETQGCVLQEAMLVGTMIVASRIGGVPESVPREMAPFLVPPADAGAIARAVGRVAAMSGDERAAYARSNRAFCERRYDVRLLNRELLAVAMGTSDGEHVA